MVHPMCRDVRDHGAAGHAENPPVSRRAGNDFPERATANLGCELTPRLFEQCEQLLRRSALPVGLKARTWLRSGERLGEHAHHADDVSDRVVKRPRPNVESAVKLIGRQLAADAQELVGGPAIVRQEDLEYVAFWHAVIVYLAGALPKVIR
jgi:hypothetical protein